MCKNEQYPVYEKSLVLINLSKLITMLIILLIEYKNKSMNILDVY